MTVVALVVGTVIAVGLLLVAEQRDAGWRRGAKVVASSGFIAIALAAGALDSRYGTMVLVGLCLGWVGDLLLTFPPRAAFLGGLVAFLLGHVGLAVAFVVRGLRVVMALTVGAVLVAPALVVWRWLRPHLDTSMKGPVAAYVVVITSMVATATATGVFDVHAGIVAGAIAFFLSDLFVARERFVTPGFINRAWGLPLYYGGQVLLALSVAV